jgi:hypothetical protein
MCALKLFQFKLDAGDESNLDVNVWSHASELCRNRTIMCEELQATSCMKNQLQSGA